MALAWFCIQCCCVLKDVISRDAVYKFDLHKIDLKGQSALIT